MDAEHVLALIDERIAEIKTIQSDNDEQELYLQGCSEELVRLRQKIAHNT